MIFPKNNTKLKTDLTLTTKKKVVVFQFHKKQMNEDSKNETTLANTTTTIAKAKTTKNKGGPQSNAMFGDNFIRISEPELNPSENTSFTSLAENSSSSAAKPSWYSQFHHVSTLDSSEWRKADVQHDNHRHSKFSDDEINYLSNSAAASVSDGNNVGKNDPSVTIVCVKRLPLLRAKQQNAGSAENDKIRWLDTISLKHVITPDISKLLEMMDMGLLRYPESEKERLMTYLNVVYPEIPTNHLMSMDESILEDIFSSFEWHYYFDEKDKFMPRSIALRETTFPFNINQRRLITVSHYDPYSPGMMTDFIECFLPRVDNFDDQFSSEEEEEFLAKEEEKEQFLAQEDDNDDNIDDDIDDDNDNDNDNNDNNDNDDVCDDDNYCMAFPCTGTGLFLPMGKCLVAKNKCHALRLLGCNNATIATVASRLFWNWVKIDSDLIFGVMMAKNDPNIDKMKILKVFCPSIMRQKLLDQCTSSSFDPSLQNNNIEFPHLSDFKNILNLTQNDDDLAELGELAELGKAEHDELLMDDVCLGDFNHDVLAKDENDDKNHHYLKQSQVFLQEALDLVIDEICLGKCLREKYMDIPMTLVSNGHYALKDSFGKLFPDIDLNNRQSRLFSYTIGNDCDQLLKQLLKNQGFHSCLLTSECIEQHKQNDSDRFITKHFHVPVSQCLVTSCFILPLTLEKTMKIAVKLNPLTAYSVKTVHLDFEARNVVESESIVDSYNNTNLVVKNRNMKNVVQEQVISPIEDELAEDELDEDELAKDVLTDSSSAQQTLLQIKQQQLLAEKQQQLDKPKPTKVRLVSFQTSSSSTKPNNSLPPSLAKISHSVQGLSSAPSIHPTRLPVPHSPAHQISAQGLFSVPSIRPTLPPVPHSPAHHISAQGHSVDNLSIASTHPVDNDDVFDDAAKKTTLSSNTTSYRNTEQNEHQQQQHHSKPLPAYHSKNRRVYRQISTDIKKKTKNYLPLSMTYLGNEPIPQFTLLKRLNQKTKTF